MVWRGCGWGSLSRPRANIRHLQKLRNGKNISRLAQELGQLLIGSYDEVRDWVANVAAARDYLTLELTRRGANVFPRAANFLLVEMKGAKEVTAGATTPSASTRGIRVRSGTSSGSAGARTRIT